VKVVCFSSLHIGRTATQIRYSVRRIRARFAQAQLVLCLWGEDVDELRRRNQVVDRDAECFAPSFAQALDCLRSEECLDEARPSGSAADGPLSRTSSRQAKSGSPDLVTGHG